MKQSETEGAMRERFERVVRQLDLSLHFAMRDGDYMDCDTWKAFKVYEAATADMDELLEALRKVANEASGFLEMASIEEHGRTNIKVLHRRILESRLLLARYERKL